MSIGRGQATVVADLDMISKVGSAFKKNRCAGRAGSSGPRRSP